MIGAASSMSRISGPAAHEVFDEQPARQQAHGALADREPPERAESGVGFDRVEHRAQAGEEAGVAEVVAPARGARFGEQLRPRRASRSSVAT